MTEFVDSLRVVNSILCVVVLISMAMNLQAYFESPRDEKFLRGAVGAYTVALLVGSLESLAYNSHPGSRTYLFTMALVWTLFSVWLERRDDRRAGRHHDNAFAAL